ncbi:MAG: DUF6502 family protein [Myxococcota bacterium]
MTEEIVDRPAQPPPALVTAVRRLLRPLVRLLLHFHITYPAFAAILKRAFVEIVDREFRLEGRAPTLSRVTLLTGIYRKEVKRLREELAVEQAPAAEPSLGALVISRWAGAPEFSDAQGRPLPLERTPSDGDRPSFTELVESVSRDIRPRSVLDEWLRLGVVEIDADDRVRLRADAFVPASDVAEKSRFFGRNLHDHLAAAAHNLTGGRPPMLERSVFYAKLTPESVERLEGRARRLAMRAIQTLNREALELQQKDADARGAVHRMNFGVYFYGDHRDRHGEGSDE